MSTESQMFPSRAAVLRDFRRALAVAVAATLGLLGIRLAARAFDGGILWLLGSVSLGLLVFGLIKWGQAAEHLAKAKGISHPMYGILGPCGLLMVVIKRPSRQALT